MLKETCKVARLVIMLQIIRSCLLSRDRNEGKPVDGNKSWRADLYEKDDLNHYYVCAKLTLSPGSRKGVGSYLSGE